MGRIEQVSNDFFDPPPGLYWAGRPTSTPEGDTTIVQRAMGSVQNAPKNLHHQPFIIHSPGTGIGYFGVPFGVQVQAGDVVDFDPDPTNSYLATNVTPLTQLRDVTDNTLYYYSHRSGRLFGNVVPPNVLIDVDGKHVFFYDVQNWSFVTPLQDEVTSVRYYYDLGRHRLLGNVVPPNVLRGASGFRVQFSSLQNWQYVRQQITPTAPLSPKENEEVKALLNPGKGDAATPLQGGVDQKGLEALKDVLRTQALKGIAQYNKERKGDVDVSPGSDYNKILQLALTRVERRFGSLVAEALKESAGSIFATKRNAIRLHQADSRWQGFPSDRRKIAEEAMSAAQYMLDTDGDVQAIVKKISQHHKENLVSVEQGYLEALRQDAPGDVFKALAEYRVRWSPLTSGSDIYIGTPVKLLQFDAWTQLKYLVHEAMHTVAHPNFEQYLHTEVPPEVSNTILEGTVDYFAQQVWVEIVDGLQANRDDPEVEMVHSILPKPTRKVSSTLLGKLKQWADLPLYRAQVPIIVQIVKAFSQNGEDRLRAAFFYGEVYKFFPRYQ